MSLFNKKAKKGEETENIPKLPELPRLPELPEMDGGFPETPTHQLPILPNTEKYSAC